MGRDERFFSGGFSLTILILLWLSTLAALGPEATERTMGFALPLVGLALLLRWLHVDARTRGRPPGVWVTISLIFPPFALVYLATRGRYPKAAPEA